MRIWVDLTNSPHVLVMRPLIELMRAGGHQVEVTAREFAQTVELLQRFGIDHTVVGRHRGAGVLGKAIGLGSRSLALARWARRRRFDVAMGHGSNDLSVAAALLRLPSATAFDYEWAAVQHHVNCRLARAVVVPDAIPPERLHRYGARAKLRRYAGLKEEYYLADFEPDPAVLDELGLDERRPIVVVRTAPEVSLYHRFESERYRTLLDRLRDVQTVVLPRTAEHRDEVLGLGGFVVPEHAVDAQSLVYYADLVISGGGTMNREAVALGTPVYTTFEGRLGAVDAALLAQGRLHRLSNPTEVVVEKRKRTGAERVRRDPRELLGLFLGAVD